MLPEFEVAIQTVRCGMHVIRLAAADAASARALMQAECDAGLVHCPPEWCTDDVESTLMHVREVGIVDSTLHVVSSPRDDARE